MSDQICPGCEKRIYWWHGVGIERFEDSVVWHWRCLRSFRKGLVEGQLVEEAARLTLPVLDDIAGRRPCAEHTSAGLQFAAAKHADHIRKALTHREVVPL